jgi:transposase
MLMCGGICENRSCASRALEPNSEQAQELKMLTRGHDRLMRQKTRLLNQIEITLKEYILGRGGFF